MIHKYCAVYENIGIRPLHKRDIEKVRQWRNNKELVKYLSPIGEITKEAQERWYERYCVDHNSIFFTVIDQEKEKTIGTVALYDFKDNTAEVGKIVIGEDSERGKGIGYMSLLMAMCVGFTYIGVEKYRLRVCEENTIAYHIYERTGFREVGRHPFVQNLTELDMEITKEEFKRTNSMMSDVILYMEGECS